ncbi:hypothetical protein [Rhizobium laguerreae]|uniref:hypothetical protein n=1 Tax=Rhizobium laguerreae TaxID=1076926 RepID=UPI001C902F15|nr:hypothetical protein [Rhizobium laguerreae]MBY3363788.1 hypothetical protein [Rhizobium laguerreae]
MIEFVENLHATRRAEADRIAAAVADYLAETAGLDKADRLSLERRQEFFRPRFAHLEGKTRIWIASQCGFEVSRRIHREFLAALPDDDKISSEEGWNSIVHQFLDAVRDQPGFLFKSAGEKWSALELRYDCDPAGLEACRAADKEAVEASQRTCEKCGQPGRPRTGGWRKTLCDDHARGRYDD